MTRTEKINLSFAEQAHRGIEDDMPHRMPEGWHDIWRDINHRDHKRTKVTLQLDADVVRFFRLMGSGYGPRINRVLRAFMHDRLAGLIEGPETRAFETQMAEFYRQIEDFKRRL